MTLVLTKPDAAWTLGILLHKAFVDGIFPWEPKELRHDTVGDQDEIVIVLKDLQGDESLVAMDAIFEIAPYDIVPVFRCEPWKGSE